MTASHFTLPAALGLLLYGCGSDAGAPETSAHDAAPGAGAATERACALGGEAFLRARLRGALDADLDWREPSLLCDGGPRPDGAGLRVALAGALPDGSGRRVRLVFGIGAGASVADAALPTNVTVILEGEGRLFATLGDDRCTTERLVRTPAPDGRGERIEVRGFCTAPATAVGGDARLHVQTFDFTAAIAGKTEDAP
jgi:hypothetical protein